MLNDMTDNNCLSAIEAIRAAGRNADLPAVLQLTDEALIKYPTSPEIWALWADGLLWSGRLEEAQDAAAKAVELGPECAYAWGVSADVNAFNAELDRAREAMDRALALDDADSFVLEKCVSVLSVLRESDRLLQLLERWRKLHQDDDRAYALSITCLLQVGHMAESAQMLADAEERFPESAWIWIRRAEAFVREHCFDDGINLLLQVRGKMPNSQFVLGQLAAWLANARRVDEAETAAKSALELNARSSIAMRAMVNICRQRGNDREAALWHKRSVEAVPVLCHASALSEANAALRSGQWKKALRVLDMALDAPSQHTRMIALGMKARILLDNNQVNEAAKIVEQLKDLGEQSSAVYEFESRVMLVRKDLAGAVKVARGGIECYPNSGMLRAILIQALHYRGAHQEEAIAVREAFDNLPQFPPEFVYLVMALDDAGHEREAQEMAQLGLGKFPGTEELKLFQAMDRLKMGDTAGAKAKAEGVSGEMRGVAEEFNKGVSRIERARQMFEQWRRKRQAGGKPPTLN